MLRELQIENVGIIEKLNLEWEGGLNVLTGETGAGKSIIIAAFSMLLGEKIKPQEMIRAGTETAKVSAILSVPESSEAIRFLLNSNIPVSEGEIFLQREIQMNGRNRCFINGQVVNQGMLKSLGDLLVDIHGTHDHQKLLNAQSHRVFLDRFSGVSSDLEKVSLAFHEFSSLRKDLEARKEDLRNRADKMDKVHYQIEELTYLDQITQEESELDREHRLLSDASRLRELCENVRDLGTEGESSLLGQLKRLKTIVRELKEAEPSFLDPLNELESASISISDVCEKASDLEGTLKSDPGRLEVLETELALIKKHSLKYGRDLKGLKEMLGSLRESYSCLENPEDIEKLEKKLSESYSRLMETCGILTVKRKKSGQKLEKLFEKELKDLGMPYAKVLVHILSREPAEDGADKVEFLLASNPGEEPKPLGKIASGGELCRIMLAFKTILSSVDDIPVLVFDEIDANIGGVTSVAAAQKMRAIGQSRQVITITHQPQIAAKAVRHFCVEKHQTKNQTRTSVRLLSKEDRVDEIARMLGGTEITSVVKEHAREMLSL